MTRQFFRDTAEWLRKQGEKVGGYKLKYPKEDEYGSKATWAFLAPLCFVIILMVVLLTFLSTAFQRISIYSSDFNNPFVPPSQFESFILGSAILTLGLVP